MDEVLFHNSTLGTTEDEKLLFQELKDKLCSLTLK